MPFYAFQISNLQETSAAFRISGPDANTYLGGQFTQELKVAPGRSAYGLWLNQKGKTLADSQVLRLTDDEHLVFSARTPAARLRERLEAYLIADEVELTDVTAQHAAIALWGDGVEALLGALGFSRAGEGESADRFWKTENAFAWPARLASAPGAWLLVARADLAAWRERLAMARVEFVDRAAGEHARITAGIPAVPDDIGPDELPNEGGLDAVAISYTKGCYLGQEVMSRLKNLGQVRRRLFLVRGRGEPPAARTALHQGAQRVGELRSAARDGDGYLAFALLSLVTLDRTRPLGVAPDGAAEISLVDPHG